MWRVKMFSIHALPTPKPTAGQSTNQPTNFPFHQIEQAIAIATAMSSKQSHDPLLSKPAVLLLSLFFVCSIHPWPSTSPASFPTSRRWKNAGNAIRSHLSSCTYMLVNSSNFFTASLLLFLNQSPFPMLWVDEVMSEVNGEQKKKKKTEIRKDQ